MTRSLVALRLFLCSYSPLFLILGVRWWPRGPLAYVMLGACVLGAVLGFGVIRAASRITPSDHDIVRVEDRGSEVAGYLATYLLPFVTVSDPSDRDLLAYAIFLVLAALLYVRSDMLQINPTLYLLGWRVLAVETSGGWSAYLLTRTDHQRAQTLTAVRFGRQFLIEAGTDR